MEFLRALLSGTVRIIFDYFGNLRDSYAQQDWFIFVILLLIGTIVGSFLAWVAWGLFLRLERVGMLKHEASGTIVDKVEDASPMYVTQQIGGGVGIATPIITAPSYYVEIRVPGGKDEYDTMEVNRKFYKWCQDGARVKVSYRYGRFTGRLHIYTIWG